MAEDFSSVYWERTSPEDKPLLPSDNESFEAMPLNEPGPSSAHAPQNVVDNSFIRSVVSEPQKEQEGSQNAYISYLITTSSNNPVFESPTFSVRRRFSDFWFLFTMLYWEYPTVAVPPLPDKSRMEYIKGDRFGPDFTMKRAGSLNRFLDRVAMHPGLKKAPLYLQFLEAKDWNVVMKSLHAKYTQALQENGVLEGFSDSLLNAFSKVNKPDDELVDVKEKIVKLDDNLAHVAKSCAKVVRRQTDIATDLNDFSETLIKLASLEGHLEKQITKFAEGTHNLGQGISTLKSYIDVEYIVSLRDMQNYILSLRSLIKLREQKQLDLEALNDYLAKSKQEKASLLSGTGSTVNFLRSKLEDVRGVNHEASKRERIAHLDVKITSLEQEIVNVTQSNAVFQDLVLNEIQIFEMNKRVEMKKTLSSFVDAHISFYQSIVDQWGTKT